MIKLISKLLKVLNSESDPAQISLALCFSMIAGFSPFSSLHNIIILLLVLVLRVNLTTFILGFVFFSGIAYILDPLFNWVGVKVLTAGALRGLWEYLYNLSFFRIDRFNNSIVMGSLLISLILVIPLYIFTNMAIIKYREHVLSWANKLRSVQIIKTSKLYKTYRSISSLKAN